MSDERKVAFVTGGGSGIGQASAKMFAARGYAVAIDNIGGMAAPVDLRLHYSDGSSETVHETPAIWAADQAHAAVRVKTAKTLQSLELEGGIFVDADSTNNRWTAAAKAKAE